MYSDERSTLDSDIQKWEAYNSETDARGGRVVPVSELLIAIESETRSLEEMANSLEREISLIRAHLAHGRSEQDNLQRSAYRSALIQIGGKRLKNAERLLKKSRENLNRVAAAISRHNKAIQGKGFINGIVSILSDNKAATRLAERRTRAMSDYQRALAYWHEVATWINDPKQVEAAITLGQKKISAILALKNRQKDMSIRLRLLNEDIALRRDITRRLNAAPADAHFIVHQRDLDKTINDPLFTSQLLDFSSHAKK